MSGTHLPAAATAETSSDSTAPLLDVSGLTVQYGRAVIALKDVSISVEKGSITTVLGGNGAGKSTLMRAISGTLRRNGGSERAGTVSLHGKDIGRLSIEARTRSGVVQVPEGRRVFGRLTVEENLRVGRFGNTKGKRKGDLAEVYDLFPVLADKRKQQAALLSGGEQQMLAIGRALMASPTILLLDEPTLGLAPLIIDQIIELLTRIRSRGTTLLLVEQNAGVALDLADHAYILSTGEVALSGPTSALRADDRVQRLYLGESIEDTNGGGHE